MTAPILSIDNILNINNIGGLLKEYISKNLEIRATPSLRIYQIWDKSNNQHIYTQHSARIIHDDMIPRLRSYFDIDINEDLDAIPF